MDNFEFTSLEGFFNDIFDHVGTGAIESVLDCIYSFVYNLFNFLPF